MSEKNNILEQLDAESFRHVVPLQLRFNDIDVLGHVNNNAQLALFDVGKTEFDNTLRGALADWNKVDAVIVNINCTFMHQILFTDPMEVRTKVKKIGERSFVLQQILRNSENGQICSMCESVMVSIDFETKTPKTIPQHLVSGLEKWM